MQVGTNGLISFDIPYNAFFTSPFPGSVSTLNLVAPYWDDVDTRGGNGQISYEIHEDDHYINQVNSFINTVRPSRFEGTWMLVVTWDAVHPYFGASNPQVIHTTATNLHKCYGCLLRRTHFKLF